MKCETNSSADAQALWLGKAAPRYTSYPPAPFFHTRVGADDYVKSLNGLAADEAISLYVHIPFCRSLCLYCGCNTLITQRSERIQEYLVSLKREIKMVAALAGKRRVNFLHFGGGTPNTLGEQDLRDLFASLRESFDLDECHEIAMELDPRVMGPDQAKILAECGVNRVSLGGQDFNPEVQEIVNRHQPFEMVARVCDELRAAGITRINIDLMYGLPKQTMESIAETATLVASLHPDRVALFGYAHVPQFKKHQAALEAFGLPDVHERLVLDQTARSVLISNGYQALGIDHFGTYEDTLMRAWREHRLHRNFQGYTEDAAANLIGLGSSSISQTVDGYFQSEYDEQAYQNLIEAGTLPVRRGFLLSPEDRLRRAIIEQLMCMLSCDVEEICQKHNFSIETLSEDFKRIQPFEDAGIISRQGTSLSLTTPYRMAIRVVCKAFDNYSRDSQMLTSKTA